MQQPRRHMIAAVFPARVMGVVACLALLAWSVHGWRVDAAAANEAWVVSWTGSAQGPYPLGNPLAQPDLTLAFPAPATGARDQSFRMIVTPSIWGRQARIRLSNALGTTPATLDGVHVGLHLASAAIVPGTSQRVTFGGNADVTIAPGQFAWSDPVALPFVRDPGRQDLAGRKLAVSFHVVGTSGPITWHAKALQTSYLTTPGAGSVGHDERESAFPLSTTSWYFLDALDMRVPGDAFAVVAFGDSITDGTLSTLNGDDRWPDVLGRRVRAVHGNRVAVVNAGIGGNRVTSPEGEQAQPPTAGGPSALARLERDVLSLSGVGVVIWLEGINDFGRSGNATVAAVESGMTEGVRRMRARIPGIRVIGATLTPSAGSTSPNHGFPEQLEKRERLNAFIRGSGVFDGVADFDQAVTDRATGALRREFVHDTTTGGAGDWLHPNRLGYLAMAGAIDLDLLKPRASR